VVPGISWRSVLTLPFGVSVIPVENPAPTSPVLGPTGASSWIVPSKLSKLVMVSMVSAQYPNETLTLPGLAAIVKSGLVARTGFVRPRVPNSMSVSSKTIIVLEPAPVRKTFYLLAFIRLSYFSLGHLRALYTGAD